MTVPVPDTLEEALSPRWLSAALRPHLGDIDVVDVIPGPVVSRITTNARFRIVCSRPLPPTFSADLCVKGYFNDLGRAARVAGPPEALFYRDLAGEVGLRTLRAVYADVDRDSGHGVIVTRDVIVDGTSFLSAASEFSVDQAATSLGELARLHAATWNRTDLAEQPWLASRFDRIARPSNDEQIRRQFAGPNAANMPAAARDADRLLAAYRIVEQLASTADPWCVIHGDPHPGNLIIDRAGCPGFIDWQLVQCGPWFIDVGYHLAAALTTEQRRTAGHSLVLHYLDELSGHGIIPPGERDAWQAIRAGMVHGLFLWAITRYVDPPTIAIMLERLGTAVVDHDAFALTPA